MLAAQSWQQQAMNGCLFFRCRCGILACKILAIFGFCRYIAPRFIWGDDGWFACLAQLLCFSLHLPLFVVSVHESQGFLLKPPLKVLHCQFGEHFMKC